MEQQKKNDGVASTAIRGVQAARHIQGAVKTGKAIAGAAKGAAAGGPLGAVIGAICDNRLFLMAAAVIGLIFLIPVLFIMMLPSLVFGSLTAAQEVPVMNNNAAINQNVITAENIIRDVLEQSHAAVLEKINQKVKSLGENDTSEINDAYAFSIPFSTALLISQYSASKNYAEIGFDDLRRTLEKHKDKLFSYTAMSEQRANQETGETSTHHIFEVTYAGDSYFADNVFCLDAESKELAFHYAENMQTFLYGTQYGAIMGGIAGTANVNDKVQGYTALITKYAEQYGIAPYIEIIKAIMMAESNGNGLDPMQSSECPYNKKGPNKPNAIQDPEYSINVGIQYFAGCLRDAGCTSPADTQKLYLALQGYNYGGGYIGWALKHYGGYSEANAIEFSNKRKAELGWSGYGNPKYVAAVMRYYVNTPTGSDGWGSPLALDWKPRVTSEFGTRIHPVSGKVSTHTGLDIGLPFGTPIYAVKDGTVITAADTGNGYGKHIVLDHGGGIRTLYGHSSQLLVSAGQQVKKGQMIAKAGSTGISTGNHLHIEVIINGQKVNPRNYIN